MREILFRGKRTDNGEWVQGDLLQWANSTQIITKYCDNYARRYDDINPETVGQYTGFTDKNGTKIFEGDYWIDKDDNDIFVVGFRDGQYCFVVYGTLCVLMPYGYDEFGFGECDCVPMTDYDIDTIKIIGNTHDNPELLERK